MYCLEYKNSVKITKLLIDRGANINQKDKNNQSTIYYLLKNFSVKSIKNFFYLFKNVKIEIKDFYFLINHKEKFDLIFNLKTELKTRNFFNWNYLSYLYWIEKESKIPYLLIYNHN